MGKTPQLLVTACLGYFVAVACSGANLDGGALAGAAGGAGAAGATGSAGAGLGIDVPDASAAGAAGGAACDCQPRQPVVVTANCTQGPASFYECVALFPGKTAQELSAVRVQVSVAGCPSMSVCDMSRQQGFTSWQSVAWMSPNMIGYEDGKVTAVVQAGATSATFILP